MSSAPVEQNTQTVSLSEVLSALRRRRLTVVSFALVGMLFGAIYATLLPATYSATAVVALTSLPDNPLATGTPRAVNAATETQVARSTEVLKLATDKLGGATTPSQLSRSLTVSSPVDSQAITITVDATTPTAAADGSNAVAQAYLEFRSTAIKNQIDELARTLDAQIEDLTRQQVTAQASVAARAPTDRAGLQAQDQTISNLLERQREQRAALDTSLTQIGQQVGIASPPAVPSGLSERVLLLAGLAVGLVLGIVFALARDRIDRRIISADQVHNRMHVDVLAEIDGRRSSHHQHESYQRLATVLAAELTRTPVSPLLVASVDGVRVGKVAARLATALARHVRPLALVSTAEAAADNIALVESAATDGGLQVRPLSTESSIRVGDVQRVVDPQFEVVIDGADVRKVSTTIALAATARTAVVVIQLGTTRTEDLRSGLRDLSAAGVRILGAVLLREGRRSRLRSSRKRAVQAPRSTPVAEPAPSDHASSDETSDEVGGSHSELVGLAPVALDCPRDPAASDEVDVDDIAASQRTDAGAGFEDRQTSTPSVRPADSDTADNDATGGDRTATGAGRGFAPTNGSLRPGQEW